MFDLAMLGKWLMIAGGVLVVVGGALWLLARVPGLNLGRLPGDIQVQLGNNVSCFFPIVTMLLLSLLLTIVVNVVIRLLNR
jgi:hypothetical protein